MRHAVIASLLAIAGPVLLFPAGIELRMCFCGGQGGGCCATAPAKPGCPGCCHAARRGERATVLSKTAPRCPGCMRLSMPARDPAANAPVPVVVDAAAPSAAVALAPPEGVAPSVLVERPALRHPPPGQRSLPLLI